MKQPTDNQGVETLNDDGSDANVTADELRNLKNEMDSIMRDAAADVTERRRVADDARFCRWEGQSADGLVRRASLDGKDPFPFEGAPDSRVRTADLLVNERARLLVAAATRGRVQVEGMESRDAELGAHLAVVLKWVMDNQLGSSWRRTLERLAQFQEGDVPAGAVLGVYWDNEVSLERAEMGLEELLELYVASPTTPTDMDPAAAATQFVSILTDGERAEEVEALLAESLPYLKPRTRRRMVKELRANFVVQDGVPSTSANYPRPYVKRNGLKLCAHRLFEDVFFPAGTHDIQRARVIFIREWLTEVEMRERVFTHGYSEEYVNEVLEHEGQTGFPAYERADVVEGTLVADQYHPQTRKGLYEQITAYHRAVNEDGIPGIYYTCFHHGVEMAAKERQLLPYKHGDYPFIWFGRETLNHTLWDSRSVPELVASMQQLQKIFWDSYGAHVQLSTVPPVKVPKNKPTSSRLSIGPLAEVKEGRPGEIAFMSPPAYPASNDKARVDLERQVDLYFGRFSPHVPQALTQLHVQDMTDRFLASLKDAYLMAIQLIQQYLDDETLSRVTGAKESLGVSRTREEIQGKFDLTIDFDAKDLDMDHVTKKAEVIGKWVLPMDTLNVTQRDRLVSWLMSGLFPNLADDVILPGQQASRREAEDEMQNFALIAAGVEPPMLAEGQDHQTRLQVLNQIGQMNPAAFERLEQDSRAILEARLKHLGHMVQQRENAKIGATGAASALQQGGPAY